MKKYVLTVFTSLLIISILFFPQRSYAADVTPPENQAQPQDQPQSKSITQMNANNDARITAQKPKGMVAKITKAVKVAPSFAGKAATKLLDKASMPIMVGSMVMATWGLEKIEAATKEKAKAEESYNDVVAIFTEKNFEGEKYYLKEGMNYPHVNDISVNGYELKRVPNDKIASIKIMYKDEEGIEREQPYDSRYYYEVTLYSDYNYQGKKTIIRTQAADLDQFEVGASDITSIKVSKKIMKKRGMYIFDRPGFNGQLSYVPPGNHVNLSKFEVKDKQAASVDISGDYEANVFSENNFTGETSVYRQYSFDLNQDSIGNQKISSIRLGKGQSFEEGIYVFEFPHNNGRFRKLVDQGIYNGFPGLRDNSFRSIIVIGNYEVSDPDLKMPGLEGEIGGLFSSDTVEGIKNLEVKKEEEPK